MDTVQLNRSLLDRTQNRWGLPEAVDAYATAVRDTAHVLEISIRDSEISDGGGGIALQLGEQPVLPVMWEPTTGWFWVDEDGLRSYRVTREADAAGVLPAPETVAAWLQTLAAGDRSGHREPPEEPAPDDAALLELLATHGNGHQGPVVR